MAKTGEEYPPKSNKVLNIDPDDGDDLEEFDETSHGGDDEDMDKSKEVDKEAKMKNCGYTDPYDDKWDWNNK